MPFAVLMLVSAGKKDLLNMTVVLQTVAANLGSMLLPVGNPQNLYLWGISGMPVGEFVKLMLPCWLLSLVLLFAACFLVKKEPIGAKQKSYKVRKISLLYGGLFALCLCVVAGWVPYYYAMPLITVVVLIADRHLLRRVDYLLLLTFVCFFIFIGNMKNIQMVSDAIAGLLGGREFLVGVAASQVISNVPAAILLSGFTDQIRTLILATDIGGLGTLIASLASLISYNAYVKVEGADPKRYMVTFTLMNIVFLILLCVFVLTLRIY